MASCLLMVQGSGGDIFPFVRIGKELKKRGHDVVLLTHCCYKDLAGKAGLNFAALDTPDEYEQAKADRGLLANTPKDLAAFYHGHILPKVIEKVEIIRGQCHAQNTILIAHHTCHLNAQIAAEKLKIPFVMVFSAPGFARSMPLLEGLFDFLAVSINQLRAEIELPPMHNWGAWLGAAKQSIGLWPDWFDTPDGGHPPGLAPVGFVLDDDAAAAPMPDGVQENLISEEAPILITHGTTTPSRPEFFTASAQACHALGHPGLLVTAHEEWVPSSLPGEVRWVKYLPFSRVMPFMGAIIHHGGIGTLAQALIAGIPQLVLPLGFDRPDNARRLVRLGVGEVLPPSQWQPDLIAGMLHKVMESPSVRQQCKVMALRMSSMNANAVATACDVVESRVAGGSGMEYGNGSEQADRRAALMARLSPEKRALLARRLKE